ncbi:IS66 family transposase [Lujinxingia vulgaris]|nr:transposase [Lujinxingia vulgaris]
MLWTFLDHEGVEPTNNSAERALRGPVIPRKLSWGSKSEAGLRLMERLWTTAETCPRQGRSLLDYITAPMEALRGERAAPVLALA